MAILLWRLDFVWPPLILVVLLPMFLLISAWSLSLSLSIFWVDGIVHPNGLVFCSVDMLASVFQGLVLWPVASQFLFEIHLWLPNHSALTPFWDATQSVPKSHFPGWFPVFQVIPISESDCTCAFKRKSSSFQRALKVRVIVMNNSWDSFLMTWPSIFSNICEMYFSVIPGTNMAFHWLLLTFSCASLEIPVNFRLIPNAVISWRDKTME